MTTVKPHFCFMNWSRWSGAVDGYGGQIQVRSCLVCGSMDWRAIGYANQVKSAELNEAAKEVIATDL